MVGETRLMLTRETTIINPSYEIGDVKYANYNISFTAGQLVEPESGWFLMNGATISATTYPSLAARYGTTLPDHTEGKIPIGRGLTSFTTYAATGGEITHALTSAETPTHTHTDTLVFADSTTHSHTGSMSALSGGSHTHAYTYDGPFLGSHGGGTIVMHSTSSTLTTAGGASHGHGFASLSYGSATVTYTKSGGISSTGTGGHNNMMPYIVIGGLLVKHD